MHALEVTLPLFAIIALGYSAKKIDFLTPDFFAQLNRLVYYLMLPAMLFARVSRIEFNTGQFGMGAFAYLVTVLTILAIAFVSTIRLDPASRGAFVQGAFRSNLAYLGIPLVAAVVGDVGIPIAAGVLVMGVLAHTILTVVMFRVLDPRERQASLLRRLRTLLFNPLIASIVLGVVVSYLQVQIPQFIADTLDLLARSSLPMVLLIVGYTLSFGQIRRQLGISTALVLFKLVLMPSVAYVLFRFAFDAPPAVVATGTIMAGMPTAVMSQTFAKAFNSNESVASVAVTVTTLGAAVTFPLLVMVFGL